MDSKNVKNLLEEENSAIVKEKVAQKKRGRLDDSIINSSREQKTKNVKSDDTQVDDEFDDVTDDEEISEELEESLLNDNNIKQIAIASTPNKSSRVGFSDDTTVVDPPSQLEIKQLNQSLESLIVTNTSTDQHHLNESFERRIVFPFNTSSLAFSGTTRGRIKSTVNKNRMVLIILLLEIQLYPEYFRKGRHEFDFDQRFKETINSPSVSSSSASTQKENLMSSGQSQPENMEVDDLPNVAKLLVITPQGYPATLISQENKMAIMKHVRESAVARRKLEATPAFDQEKIVDFGDVLMQSGQVHIACYNSYTAMWISQVVKTGIQSGKIVLPFVVKCAPKEKTESLPTFAVYCSDQTVDFEKIKQRMKDRRNCPSDDWTHLNSSNQKVGTRHLFCSKSFSSWMKKAKRSKNNHRVPVFFGDLTTPLIFEQTDMKSQIQGKISQGKNNSEFTFFVYLQPPMKLLRHSKLKLGSRSLRNNKKNYKSTQMNSITSTGTRHTNLKPPDRIIITITSHIIPPDEKIRIIKSTVTATSFDCFELLKSTMCLHKSIASTSNFSIFYLLFAKNYNLNYVKQKPRAHPAEHKIKYNHREKLPHYATIIISISKSKCFVNINLLLQIKIFSKRTKPCLGKTDGEGGRDKFLRCLYI